MDGYLGIDVSKDGLAVMLVRDQRHEAQHFTNSEPGFAKLHNWVKGRLEPPAVHACLEATGPYSEAIAEFVYRHGYRVSVVNPARIKG
jgi:transposase